jgi:hypothetical protein
MSKAEAKQLAGMNLPLLHNSTNSMDPHKRTPSMTHSLLFGGGKKAESAQRHDMTSSSYTQIKREEKQKEELSLQHGHQLKLNQGQVVVLLNCEVSWGSTARRIAPLNMSILAFLSSTVAPGFIMSTACKLADKQNKVQSFRTVRKAICLQIGTAAIENRVPISFTQKEVL